MSVPHFENRTLTEVVKDRPPLPGLFKELFFSSRRELRTRHVEVRVVVRGRKLVPIVTDYEGGTLVEKSTRKAFTVTPPRLNPIDRFSGPELIDITDAGEIHYVDSSDNGEVDIEEVIVEQLDSLKDDCELTIEHMCAQAVVTGKITIIEGGVEKFQVDFNMPNENIIVLAAEKCWDQVDSDPSADLEDWARLIASAAGLNPDTLVCGWDAWQVFNRHEKVRDDLDRRRIEIGHLSPDVNKQHKGVFNGLDIYACGDEYEDYDGSMKALLDPSSVVLGCTHAQTKIEFAVPTDLENRGKKNQYFSKSWLEKNPSALWLGVESCPLPVPYQPGAFVVVKVL